MQDNEIREALSDFLGILQYKVQNGALTAGDVRAIFEIILAGGGIQATVREIAGYYHQSEDNVRHIIHRNLFPAPTRRVYYDFSVFRRRVPTRWTKKSTKSDG